MLNSQNCIIANVARVARFSQFDGAQFWIVLFIVNRNFIRKLYDTLYCLTQDSSYVLSKSYAHFGMTFAYFWFWIPRNKPNERFYGSFGAQGFRLEIEGVKGDYGTFTYSPAFFLPLAFENSSQRFIEYSTVTFGFDPCALLPTGYRKRAEDDTFWCMQWHQDVIV